MTAALGAGTHAADRAVKVQHRAMWALGDYPAVAAEVLPQLGEVLVAACDVAVGDEVLDVAAGSGNAAIPAALNGADVVACDLTPELFVAGRARAAERRADVEWVEADAEALPFTTGQFGVVLSCIGVMFAPHHQAAADELVRVCRPGGTIGLLSWTPDGFVGQMFAGMAPFAPAPPPPGAQPPPLWGDPDHVRALLGDRVTDVTTRRQTITVDRFSTTADWLNYFKVNYGPTVAVYRSLAADPQRVAELDRELLTVASRHVDASGAMRWEYLLLTARRT
jgi:SAM-dependent methyltransferase